MSQKSPGFTRSLLRLGQELISCFPDSGIKQSLLDACNGKPHAYLKLRVQDCDHSSLESFERDYFLMNLLRKYEALETGFDRKAIARGSWDATERRLKDVNERLSPSMVGQFGPTTLNLISRIQRKIEKVLGPNPTSQVLQECRWSGGATSDLRRGTSYTRKMIPSISVSRYAQPYLQKVLAADVHWTAGILGIELAGPSTPIDVFYKIEEASRWLVVPKNAKTFRVIEANPTGNTFLQQGIHSWMRRRMHSFGIRLDDQSINQKLAALALSYGLATLDLESASDSISCSLVWLLLPVNWAFLLDNIRTRYVKIGDSLIKTE
jgi:hypothetical protein